MTSGNRPQGVVLLVLAGEEGYLKQHPLNLPLSLYLSVPQS
jgi:hypothetical protein